MIISRSLTLVLIVILAMSPLVGSSPDDLRGLDPAPAALAAPQAPGPAVSGQVDDPGYAAKRKSRIRGKRDSRSGQQKNQKKERKARSATVGRSTSATGGNDDCGPGLVPIGDTGLCTHGADPEPPGIERDLIRGVPTAREVNQETAGIACVGDGQTGHRVQVVYAYDSTVGSRYGEVLGNIRITAAGADDLMRDSSIAGGRELHFRFVQDTQCNIDVQQVGFSYAEMQNFGTMIQRMISSGQNRKDRIYLIFADTTSAGICGIGTLIRDDQDSPNNRNNSGPGYSRVDRNCWAPQAATHELMHNLGGVQHSAPHSSGGGHCIDEWDVMCYSDHPSYPAMQYPCGDKATYQNRIDCNFDDYFHPSPPAGSYLDTHWNTADSFFLHAGPGMCAGSAQSCLGSIDLATSRSSVKSKKRLRLSATVSGAMARNATVTVRACKGSSCTWEAGNTIATLSGGAPTTQWKASGKGSVTFLAQVTTGDGVATSNPVTVKVKKEKKKR